MMKDSAFWSRLPPPASQAAVLAPCAAGCPVWVSRWVGGWGSHLPFADDEKGVSSGPLPDDVLAVFVVCLSGEERRRSNTMSLKRLRCSKKKIVTPGGRKHLTALLVHGPGLSCPPQPSKNNNNDNNNNNNNHKVNQMKRHEFKSRIVISF